MNLELRGKYWRVVFYDKNKKRRKVSTGCLKNEKDRAADEASKIIQRLNSDITDGDTKGKTLSEALLSAYPDRRPSEIRGADRIDHDARRREWLSKRHGSTLLTSIRYKTLKGWREEWLKLGNSNSTANKKMAFLGKTLKHSANELEWLSRSEVPAVPKQLPIKKARAVYFTDEQLANIFELLDMWEKMPSSCAIACKFPWKHLKKYIEFTIDAGTRLSETRQLEPEDIILSPTGRYTLHLRGEITKSGKERSIPLTNRAKGVIDYFLELGYENPFQWITSSDYLCSRWRAVRGAVGLADKYTLHVARHTFASRLVQRGVSLYEVKELLGHATIQMTEIYAHLAPHSLESCINVLE